MNDKKKEIEQLFSNGNTKKLYKLIEEYEKEYPFDLDLYAMKTNYYLCIGDLDAALLFAKKGVSINPYNADMYYNLAIISEELFDLKSSCENYLKANAMFAVAENALMCNHTKSALERIIGKIEQNLLNSNDIKLRKEMLGVAKYVNERITGLFDMYSFPFREYSSKLINSTYNDGKDADYFIAVYNRWTNFAEEESSSVFTSDLLRRKGEFVKIHTTSEKYEFDEECDILLPVFYEKDEDKLNTYRFYTNQSYYDVVRYSDHFNYYRLPGKVKVESVAGFNSIIGKPILLKQDSVKKKLILNIFVDSLPQVLLNLPDFMPYTKEFFSKGITCNNVYSDSEWTLPSAATIFTGLNSAHHMNICPGLNIYLPKDITLISEYFQNEGYYTAKIGGNYALTPDRGYLRGFDRFIYQYAKLGLDCDELISDTIEHIKMAGETNQFLWIDICDLHDISSGFDLPPSVQAEASIDDIAGYRKGTKSAKQGYNEHSINLVKLVAKKVDFALSYLYNYINQNYEDNDIVVSLFSDHGLSFMVKEDEHFFAPARSNTALMIRSSFKQGICKEYISTADYIEIMGKLAGIPISSTIDSNLPKYFGGTKERQYVLSHSLYHGDCYKAAMHSDKYSCYISTDDKIGHDGRFNLTNYTITIFDKYKNKIHNKDLEEYYLNELKKNIAHLQLY